MEHGQIIKSQTFDNEALAKINRLTRRELSEDEVFTFSIRLCDNDVDRDNERFTLEALKRLAELYIGKTGIFDHSMKATQQVARIYETEVVIDGMEISTDEPKAYLKASAYMVKSEKNRDLILDIEAGITKEVSVGCSIGEIRCSICGADIKKTPCQHIKGKSYNGKTCHYSLDAPLDAYEFSFVAVPAQRKAGIIKSSQIAAAEEIPPPTDPEIPVDTPTAPTPEETTMREAIKRTSIKILCEKGV